jgi:endoglucanase
VDDKGFIYFTTTGGWFDQTLLNQRMILHTENGPIYGVIGSKPPHVMKEDEAKKPIKAADMFIDIGATSNDDADKMGVRPGTPITSDTKFKTLGNDLVTGKALDDRGGCAVLIEALSRIRDVKATVHAVFTVQEEVGLKGTSAFGLNPDVALVSEVTYTGDQRCRRGRHNCPGKCFEVAEKCRRIEYPIPVKSRLTRANRCFHYPSFPRRHTNRSYQHAVQVYPHASECIEH